MSTPITGRAGSQLDRLAAAVGGRRNAAMIAGAGAVGAILLGRHRHKKASTTSTDAPVMAGTMTASGYDDSAIDPTALYTGYDQLQQQIDTLRTQPGAPNTNPVPVPTAPGATTPPAPVPPPPVAAPTPPAPSPVYHPPAPVAYATPPAPKPKSMVYTVVKGDNLWNIAAKYLGSGAKYTQIYAQNKGVIGSNPNLIRPGEKLTINL